MIRNYRIWLIIRVGLVLLGLILAGPRIIESALTNVVALSVSRNLANDFRQPLDVPDKALSISRVQFLLGVYRYYSGDYIGALEYLQRAMVNSNQQNQFAFFVALSYHQLGDETTAVRYFQQAGAYVYLLRSSYQECNNGHLDQALKYADLAVQVDSQQESGWLELGDVQSLLQNWPAALGAYNRARQVNASQAPYVGLCEAESHLNYAHAEVLSCLDSIPPTADFELVLRRGWAYGGIGEHQRAREQYYRAIDISPGSNLPDFYVGLSYESEKNWTAAIAAYERSLSKDYNNPNIQSSLASAYAVVGDWLGAVKHFEAAVMLGPERQDDWVKLGNAYLQLGRLEDARRAFMSALRLSPGNPQIIEMIEAIP